MSLNITAITNLRMCHNITSLLGTLHNVMAASPD